MWENEMGESGSAQMRMKGRGRMKKLDTRKEVGERMRKWDVRYKETKLKGELRWGNGNFGTKNEKWVSE